MRVGTYENAAAEHSVYDREVLERKHRATEDGFGLEVREGAPPPGQESADPTPASPDLAVSYIKAAITAKQDWKAKVMSAQIVNKWRVEATKQGASSSAFDKAVSELKRNDYYSLSGIVHKDGLLPPELVERVTSCLDRVAEKSTDFHPHSGNTVRNLIHPSLYCYVQGESWPRDLQTGQAPQDQQQVPAAEGFRRRRLRPEGPTGLRYDEGEADMTDRFAHCLVGIEEWSRYQWLPAEFDVDEKGAAKLASYVNNAPEDPGLCQVLEETLSTLLPSFEQVVTPPESRGPVSLRSRRLQVIVKAANYELKPGQSYKGGWHVEGMLHERIVAAGIVYYAATPNMRGDGLAFRRLRNRNVRGADWIPTKIKGEDCNNESYSVAISDATWQKSQRDDEEEEEEREELVFDSGSDEEDRVGLRPVRRRRRRDAHPDETYVPTGFVKPKYMLSGDDIKAKPLWSVGHKEETMPNYIDLGIVETPPGRAVVFKNSMQHQVRLLWNSSDTETAVRKILVFWLVDPDKRVVSTADVPRQQWDTHRAVVANLLHRQWRPDAAASKLSVGTVKLILNFAKHGFTHEEACGHRLRLMEERKYSRATIDGKFKELIRRVYSFCEH